MRLASRTPWIRRAARFMGGHLHRWAENDGDCCARRNGELRLLRALFSRWARDPRPAGVPRVVVDAGANVGNYTFAVLAASERWHVPVRVLALEPSPDASATLRQRFSSDRRVEILSLAVSDRSGRSALYAPSPGSQHASVVRIGPAGTGVIDQVEAIRLDELLAAQGVSRVDFLKLDVEGAELSALHGLGSLLDPEQVELIQFEYGGTTLDAGHRLRDFFELLEARGYLVGKLLPGAVEVRRYAPWMDHFAYANFVALAPRSRSQWS